MRNALAISTLVSLLAAAQTLPAQTAAAESPSGPVGTTEARELLQGKEGAAAIEVLAPLRAKRGLQPPVDATLAALYLEAGRPAEALEILEPLSQHDSIPAAVLFNTWKAARELGKGQDYLPLLERAATLEPLSPAGRALGFVLGSTQQYYESYALLRPWATAHPDDTEARLAAAAAAVQLERVPEAEELLSDLPQSTPQVRLLWGKVLVQKGDPYGALATLKALPEELPPAMDQDRRRTMAQAYVLSGQAAEAVKLLEGRVGNDPGAALQLSHAKFQGGDVEGAAEVIRPFAERVKATPGGVPPKLGASLLLEYGSLLVSLGDHATALPYLRLASELDQDNKMIWQSLGQALAATGEREEAQQALARFQQMTESEVPAVLSQTALEADVNDPTGRNLREAQKLVAKDRVAEALQMIRAEARLAPQDPRPRLLEAWTLLLLQQPQEALTAVDKALALDPENADARYQRGAVLMALDRLDEAEEDLRAALHLSADHPAALNDLAVLLMSTGRAEEARPLLLRVLELNPDDAVAAGNLSRLDEGDGPG